MIKQFGEEYRGYMKKTGMIFPKFKFIINVIINQNAM